ncbi:hypothetical protein ACFQY7_27230 [Actinomadura luteofluorescens]|uniref:hypothetical protein n=1 Tax=Actinomadura luteofluorescens TaxID=46163 RepID=UPI0036319569
MCATTDRAPARNARTPSDETSPEGNATTSGRGRTPHSAITWSRSSAARMVSSTIPPGRACAHATASAGSSTRWPKRDNAATTPCRNIGTGSMTAT